MIRDEKEYQSKYRNVIEYFDADKIALTATPALHTYDIFGEPVYEYSYRQAVLDGYLVDFEPPYIMETKLSKDGITFEKGCEVKVYDKVSQEVKTIENLEDELNFDVSKFNTKVITEGFNRAICNALVERIDPTGEEKTLIFCANDEHADMVVRILKEEYDKLGDYSMNNDMIKKITGSVKDVDKLIRKFKNDSYPTIAVTVDLLTTGIDVPKICNLVFLRKVKSRILYEQMIGRATRLCPAIKKECFKIYDAVGIYEDLEKYSDMKPVVANPKTSVKELFEKFDTIKDDEKATSYFMDQIIGRIQRKKNIIKEKKANDIKVLSGYMRGEEVTNIDSYLADLKNTPDNKKIKVLEKEKEFLIYLDSLKRENYKIIAENDDMVTDFKQSFGKDKTPEDYLESFKQYIKENEDKIEALKILKTNPKAFTKEDLKEIKSKLDAYGYSKTKLNTAYQNLKNEDILIDILSFIKYAIDEKDEELISRDRKIERVMEKIKKVNRWNARQDKIISRIEMVLKSEDEYISKEDFDSGIFKKQYGGIKKIDEILQGKLDEIMDIIYNGILLN